MPVDLYFAPDARRAYAVLKELSKPPEQPVPFAWGPYHEQGLVHRVEEREGGYAVIRYGPYEELPHA